MRNPLRRVLLAAFTLSLFGAAGCSKPSCESAVKNLRELAKKEPEFGKRINDEKDDELIKECEKESAGKEAELKCMTEAKTVAELGACRK